MQEYRSEIKSLQKVLCHLPPCRAGGVSPLGEVGDGGDHPIVDLCQCQPSLGGALDRLGKHILVRFQVEICSQGKIISRALPILVQFLLKLYLNVIQVLFIQQPTQLR